MWRDAIQHSEQTQPRQQADTWELRPQIFQYLRLESGESCSSDDVCLFYVMQWCNATVLSQLEQINSPWQMNKIGLKHWGPGISTTSVVAVSGGGGGGGGATIRVSSVAVSDLELVWRLAACVRPARRADDGAGNTALLWATSDYGGARDKTSHTSPHITSSPHPHLTGVF